MTQKISRRDVLKSASGLVAAATLASFGGGTTAAAQTREGRSQNRLAHNSSFNSIDGILQQAVDRHAVAGVVAMAATDTGLVYEGAAGKANVDSGSAMSPDTVFWLLSMTKAITATACMQLIEQGKLRLDQPASHFLPELAAPNLLEGFYASCQPKLRPAKRPITVRHLLTHTSGYTYSIWSENLLRYEKITRI